MSQFWSEATGAFFKGLCRYLGTFRWHAAGCLNAVFERASVVKMEGGSNATDVSLASFVSSLCRNASSPGSCQ